MEPEEYLAISGIQHFCFCRRQWALIHLEQQWSENLRTAEGRLQHDRCHNETFREKRGDLLTVRGMRVISHRLQLSGVCDVVEFHADPDGVPLQGYEGIWRPVPVEYKHGVSKQNDADRLQLCAQAMCLEEVYHTTIAEGAIFYISSHRRQRVVLDEPLRRLVLETAKELHHIRESLSVPAARYSEKCKRCSLLEYCMPAVGHSARAYCQKLAQEAKEVETV